MTAPERVQPPELDYCARCREHACFEYDEQEGWRSTCCFAAAVAADVERDELQL